MTRVGLIRSLAGAAVLSLFLGGAASATTWSEVGDAGDLPSTAQGFTGPVDEIIGSLDVFGGDLVDVFGFYIGGQFSALTIQFDEFFIADPVLYLFDAAGNGVSMDDDGGGFAQAALGALPAGFGVGQYYLAITFSGVEPFDLNGDSIFDVFGDLSVTSGNAVEGWTGAPFSPNFDLPAQYSIKMTGVPEPGTLVLMLAGLGVLGLRRSTLRRG